MPRLLHFRGKLLDQPIGERDAGIHFRFRARMRQRCEPGLHGEAAHVGSQIERGDFRTGIQAGQPLLHAHGEIAAGGIVDNDIGAQGADPAVDFEPLVDAACTQSKVAGVARMHVNHACAGLIRGLHRLSDLLRRFRQRRVRFLTLNSTVASNDDHGRREARSGVLHVFEGISVAPGQVWHVGYSAFRDHNINL